MKKIMLGSLFFCLLAGGSLTACKNKNKESTTTTTTNVDTNQARQLPVEISSDDALRKGVNDAIKDYPGVTADVNNGVVTLRGTIERDRLTKLMQTVQSLNPQRVEQQMTVK